MGPLLSYTRTEIDGVPTFYADTQLPFVATLVFRVGRADEPLPQTGLTHLVEHLAVPIEETRGLDVNATVEATQTLFYATGPPDSVAEFLAAVARALADPPLERLETERRILQTEAGGRSGPGPLGLALMLRCGARGYGGLGHNEHGLLKVDEKAVAAWAAERFARENAVLFMTGPPPTDLQLRLRSGGRRHPAPPIERIPYLRFPCFYDRVYDFDVVLSAEAERSVAVVHAMNIAQLRLRRRLRFEQGLSYGVDALYEPLTGKDAHLAFTADSMEPNTDAVRDLMVETLRELASNGPTDDELGREVELARRQLADPHDAGSLLYFAATTELFGERPQTARELLDEHEALTPTDVAAALSAALETALVISPEGSSGPPDGFEPYENSSPRPLEGTTHRPKGLRLRRDPSEPQLVAGDEGVAMVFEGDRSVVRFDECEVALRWPDGTRGLWSADGFYVEVVPELWRGGKDIVALIDARVPEDLWVSMEPELEKRIGAVEKASAERVKRNWMTSDELDALPQTLQRGEEPLVVARASLGWKLGVVAVTDRRLIFLYFSEVKLELPREAITVVEAHPKTWWSDSKLIVRTADGHHTFTDVAEDSLAELERELAKETERAR